MAEENKNFGKVLASWSFPEFHKHRRGPLWYLLAIIAGIGLLIYSLASNNYIFAFIIILVALLMFIAYKDIKEIDFKIAEDGISVGNRFYRYNDIDSFWIIYEPPEVKNLYFSLKSIVQPALLITLEKQNPVEIRETLLEYLEEDLEKEDEPLSDQLTRIFKL